MTNEMTVQQATSLVQAKGAGSAIASTRESQEVQAAVFMAKQFPRNEEESRTRILRACRRIGLASKAMYSYPKGGQKISGPSVRLMEAIAQSWGNIQSGVVELDQRDGESTCMAYCWDIETNTREVKIFQVKHAIQTKNGQKVLTDPREIYELVANQGARRKRACILNVIPGDIVDEAIEACNQTLAGGNQRPLIDRLRELTDRFMTYYSVPLESIEKYFGYPLKIFTEMDGAELQGIYTALRDGAAKREDYFQLPKVTGTENEPGPDKEPDPPRKGNKKQVSMNEL